ncbi:MAG TPA: flagellar biosynthetic protein FliO [Syntrophomonadaceae bacterium]|nr:flagellar biosynthetic protein FliO [Syntrophomonadaceae bacterium]
MKLLRRRRIVVLLAVAIILVFAASALAVDNINDLNKEINKQPGTPTGHSVVWDFVKLTFALGIIIGAAWLIVRMFGKKASTRMQGTWLHTVDEVMLGQNRGLVLCEVAGKIYAIGVTDHNINLLFEVDNPQILKEISEGNYEQSQEITPDVMEKVKELLKLKPKTSPVVKDFHNLMTEQTKRLSNISGKGLLAGKVHKENGENK